MESRSTIVVIVALVVGFGGGFVARPVIAPTSQADRIATAPPAAPISKEARGTQYFEANIDEARQVVAACQEGTMRGDECANAETALTTIESKERLRRFRGDR